MRIATLFPHVTFWEDSIDYEAIEISGQMTTSPAAGFVCGNGQSHFKGLCVFSWFIYM